MRKLFVFAVIGLLPFLTAGGCGTEKVCEPRSVRHDSYMPRRWWLCNEDGTKEEPILSPIPKPHSEEI